VIATPSELRGSAWRRTRLGAASYALGWRVYDYAGHDLVFHGGAVQGYRGAMALLPSRDLGLAIPCNSESALPPGPLPAGRTPIGGITGGGSGTAIRRRAVGSFRSRSPVPAWC